MHASPAWETARCSPRGRTARFWRVRARWPKAACRSGRAGRIAVIVEDRELAGWPVTVIPDSPPSARFDLPPRATRRHIFRIDYGGSDDYGVAAMRAEAALTDEPDAKPLVLPLPVLGEPLAPQGNAYFDLTAHIWAGREVTVQVFAVDGAGQEGEGPPLRFMLPERPFDHPVARAIVEERKTLRWNGKDAAAGRLDEIAADTELYDRDATVTLALAVACCAASPGRAGRARADECTEPALEDGSPAGGWRSRTRRPGASRIPGRHHAGARKRSAGRGDRQAFR